MAHSRAASDVAGPRCGVSADAVALLVGNGGSATPRHVLPSTLAMATQSVVPALSAETFQRLMFTSLGALPGVRVADDAAALVLPQACRRLLVDCGLVTHKSGGTPWTAPALQPRWAPVPPQDAVAVSVAEADTAIARACKAEPHVGRVTPDQFSAMLLELARKRYGRVVDGARWRVQQGTAALSQLDLHLAHLGCAWALAHYHLAPLLESTGAELTDVFHHRGVSATSCDGVEPAHIVHAGMAAEPVVCHGSTARAIVWGEDDANPASGDGGVMEPAVAPAVAGAGAGVGAADAESTGPATSSDRVGATAARTSPAVVAAATTNAFDNMPPEALATAMGKVDELFNRERRVLKPMFKFYCTRSRFDDPEVVQSDDMAQFAADFAVTPQLVSRADFHDMVRKCVPPHRDGMSYKQFLACLAAVAFKAFKGDPLAQVLGLFQALDASAGKSKMNNTRGRGIVPRFNLLQL